jgi:hypothetical protein
MQIRLRIPNTAYKKSHVLAWLLRRRREGEEEELLAEPRQPRRLQQRLPVDGRGVPGRVATENGNKKMFRIKKLYS